MDDSEYRRITARIVAIGQADDRIRAVLVFGSHATGSADAFSDLDIGLVLADAAYDDVLARPTELVRAIGEPLLLEDFGNPANLYVILADGTDLELILVRESELTLDLPCLVLLDKGGVEDAARKRPPPAPRHVDAERVRQLVYGFWHDVGHVTTALGRGNRLWAHGQLEELRGVCLSLARLEAGVEADDEPYWKIDVVLAEETVAALRGTVVPSDIGPMRGAALALVELFRQVAPGVAADHGIAYPEELDRQVTARLLALHGERG
jgi:predicted nucleotidyltransferase